MEEKERLRKMLERHAEEKSIKLNPNKKIVEMVLDGLLRNKEKNGEAYCPCRIPSGDREKDKEIICPCAFHILEIEEDGNCKCRLFVS